MNGQILLHLQDVFEGMKLSYCGTKTKKQMSNATILTVKEIKNGYIKTIEQNANISLILPVKNQEGEAQLKYYCKETESKSSVFSKPLPVEEKDAMKNGLFYSFSRIP